MQALFADRISAHRIDLVKDGVMLFHLQRVKVGGLWSLSGTFGVHHQLLDVDSSSHELIHRVRTGAYLNCAVHKLGEGVHIIEVPYAVDDFFINERGLLVARQPRPVVLSFKPVAYWGFERGTPRFRGRAPTRAELQAVGLPTTASGVVVSGGFEVVPLAQRRRQMRRLRDPNARAAMLRQFL